MSRTAVVLGAGGQLGRQLVAALSSLEYAVVALSRAELDITADDAPAAIRRLASSVVVNAAWTDVDGCARDPERARETNGSAPGRLAAAAASTGARFVQISTNEVFDGEGGQYRETDLPNPVNPTAPRSWPVSTPLPERTRIT